MPKKKLGEQIKLQSDLTRLGYSNMIKVRLELPQDFNHEAFSTLILDFNNLTMAPKKEAVPREDVLTTFGFADDLVLNRHSRDFYKSDEVDEDDDHDEHTLGKPIFPRQSGKGQLGGPIYPPQTGNRER